jgi:hypothetical protein
MHRGFFFQKKFKKYPEGFLKGFSVTISAEYDDSQEFTVLEVSFFFILSMASMSAFAAWEL